MASMLDLYNELIRDEADDAASRDHLRRLRGGDLSAPQKGTDADHAAAPPEGVGPFPLVRIDALSATRPPDLPVAHPLVPTRQAHRLAQLTHRPFANLANVLGTRSDQVGMRGFGGQP